MNICVQADFMYKLFSCNTFSFLLGVCLGVETLCHLMTLFNLEGSKVSTSLITFVSYYRYLSVFEVVFHCGFDLYFLMTNDIEHLFLCLFGYLHIFMTEISIKILGHFLLGLFIIILLSCKNSLFWIQVPY